jgi:HEAT repeat protein
MLKRDRAYFLRSAAVDALAQIGAPAVEPLISALNSSNPNVREAAATALGQIGDVRALNALRASPLVTPTARRRQDSIR